jgi:phage recombination protein Bet
MSVAVEGGYTVTRLANGRWEVVNPEGVSYRVRLSPVTRCSCKGFHFRGKCKHILMCREQAMAEGNGAALATVQHGAAVTEFTEEQESLIKRVIAPGLSDDELALFLMQCKRTGLDPFSRQIHAVKRKGKLVIQTGIDGYRLIADRTGQYAGSDDYVYDQEAAEHPGKATATVWKMVGGERRPFTRSARWKEFFPGEKEGWMWKQMPYHMLGKCAEALALRAAFPQELSGIYTDEEMMQAEAREASPAEAPAQQGPKPVVGPEQLKELNVLFAERDADMTLLCQFFGVPTLAQLPAKKFKKVKEWLLTKPLRV